MSYLDLSSWWNSTSSSKQEEKNTTAAFSWDSLNKYQQNDLKQFMWTEYRDKVAATEDVPDERKFQEWLKIDKNLDMATSWIAKNIKIYPLYEIPPGLHPVENPGGGDCLFYVLAEALCKNPNAEARKQNMRLMRNITADGLRSELNHMTGSQETLSEVWNNFKSHIIPKVDQSKLEQAVQNKQVTMLEQNQTWYNLSPERKTEIYVETFEQLIKQDMKIWGNNIYLHMFLRSPSNSFTQRHNLNILIIDRLYPYQTSKHETLYANPLCYSTPKSSNKCVWLMVLRTCLEEGRGALHFELLTLPGAASASQEWPYVYHMDVIMQRVGQQYAQAINLTGCRDNLQSCFRKDLGLLDSDEEKE